MRSDKVQKEIEEQKALRALRPLVIPNRERCKDLEVVSDDDKVNAKALLVMMRGNAEVDRSIIECLQDISEGCSHVSSKPREYIHVAARCYGYNLTGVNHV